MASYVQITDPDELQKIRQSMAKSPPVNTVSSASQRYEPITNPQEVADIRQKMGTPKTDVKQELLGIGSELKKGLDWAAQKAAVVPAGLSQVGEDVYNLAAPKSMQMTSDPYKFFGADQSPLARGIGDFGAAMATGGVADLPALGAIGARYAPVGLKALSRFGLGTAAPQAAFGAALNPSDRAQGALIGAAGAGIGKAIEAPIQKFMGHYAEKMHPIKWVQDKVEQMIHHRADLQQEADQGYGGLNAIGHVNTIEMPTKNPINYNLTFTKPLSTSYGKMEPGMLTALQNAARKGNKSAKELYDEIIPQVQLGDSRLSATEGKVKSIFSKDLMENYDNSKLIPLDVRRQFYEFSNKPTLENADLLKQEVNMNIVPKGAAGADLAMNSTLRNLKQELREKFIHPTLKEYDPNVLAGYKNAEAKFKEMKDTYGATKGIDSLSQGLVKRITPNRVLKTLEPLQEDHYYPRNGIPLNIYQSLLEKLHPDEISRGKIGLARRIGASALSRVGKNIAPKIRTAAQYKNIQDSK
jgi:hypothetical protein